MDDAEFLTVEQVAQRLLVQPAAVRTWLRRGQLRGYKLPGRVGDWRIRAEDLEVMLQSTAREVADVLNV